MAVPLLSFRNVREIQNIFNSNMATGKSLEPRIPHDQDFHSMRYSHPPDSNRRPADYESAALPTELGWPKSPKA